MKETHHTHLASSTYGSMVTNKSDCWDLCISMLIDNPATACLRVLELWSKGDLEFLVVMSPARQGMLASIVGPRWRMLAGSLYMVAVDASWHCLHAAAYFGLCSRAPYGVPDLSDSIIEPSCFNCRAR